MGYSKALEAAGAKVHQYESFGAWQGRWLALVELPDGRRGWIPGHFGSCSGCDAFQAEFAFSIHSHESHPDHPVCEWSDQGEFVEDCPGCQDLMVELAGFGRQYFGDLVSAEEFITDKLTNNNLYGEELEMVQYLLEHDALVEEGFRQDALARVQAKLDAGDWY